MKDAKWFRDKYHNDPEWRRRKKERNKKWRQKHYKELKMSRDILLGTKCTICGSIIRLCCHKKDGQPHDYGHCEKTWQMIRDNPEEWVRLCGRCHDSIHWIMKYFHLSWDEIQVRL
jgi:hypothetical protein